MDAQSEKIIYSKSANLRLPMASTTKIMTAILAIESEIPLDRVIFVPKEATYVEGSSLYLEYGEEITLEALLYGLLLCSANDASIVIATAVCGSVEGFVDKMNEKARQIGLSDTSFKNPHGLFDDGHYTSAKDLALLMSYCIKNEMFLRISGTQKRVFPRGDDKTRVMINHNRLLNTDERVISGKTGYTKKSGRCLVSVAQKDGMTLICVTLNAPDDWNDHKKLYNFGFSSYKRINTGALDISVPVISGRNKSILARAEGVSILLPSAQNDVQMRICLPRFVFSPIKKGDHLGYVLYLLDGKVIARAEIYALDDSPAISYKFNLFEWLRELFIKLRN